MPPLDVGFPSSSQPGSTWSPVALTIGKPQPAPSAAAPPPTPDPIEQLAIRCLRILATPGTTSAVTRVADEVAGLFGDVRIAIGARHNDGPCRLIALSGHHSLDHQTDYTQSLNAVLHETALLEPGANDEPRSWLLGSETQSIDSSLARLATQSSTTGVAAVRLGTPTTPSTGAIVVLGSANVLGDATFPVRLKIAAQLLAGLVPLLERSTQRGLRAYLVERWHRVTARKATYVTLGAIVVGLLTLLPLPAWVSCECLLEPHTRRYIAAPFDAKLEKSLVQPGDIVTENQILAVLDEQPLKIELGTRQAEYDEADKKHFAARAVGKAAEAQISGLEAAQIKGKIRDIEHRLQQLTVRSPTAGVVVRGDLKRSEGMPLEQGQSLFEIAPLEPMIAEVSVAEDEFRLVRVGQQASVRLDAFPGRRWTGEIARVHPRAEIRDDQSVFIAEIAIPNGDGELRPGMRGAVRVDHDWQPLAWTWFRRPVTRFARWLGW